MNASRERRHRNIRSTSLSSLSDVKPKRRRRPPWDSSVTNLDQYKPSKEELMRRHDLHRPDLSVKRFLRSQSQSQENSICSASEPSPFSSRKIAMLKEYVPQTPLQTRSVLEEMDLNISHMEQFLPEHIRRYKGLPVVTSAPDHLVTTDEDRSLIMIKPIGPSRLDYLSQSVMQQRALNDVSCSEEESESSESPQESDCVPDTFDNKSKQVTFSEQTVISGAPGHENRKTHSESSDARQPEENVPLGKDMLNNSLPKKQRHGKNLTASENVDELRKVLGRLEVDIEDYETRNGRENVLKDYNIQSSSFSGYTLSLLKTLIRLLHHLKENETQLQSEIATRHQILDGFEEQRALIDALTVDLIHVEDENAKLRDDMEQYRSNLTAQMENMKVEFSQYMKMCVTRQPTSTDPKEQKPGEPFVGKQTTVNALGKETTAMQTSNVCESVHVKHDKISTYNVNGNQHDLIQKMEALEMQDPTNDVIYSTGLSPSMSPIPYES